MANVRIKCITLSSTEKSHQHITHVGSDQFQPAGSKWTVEQVVSAIEKNEHTFYVQDSVGNVAYVGVVDPGNGGRKFIRTHADGKWSDNLLSLPTC